MPPKSRQILEDVEDAAAFIVESTQGKSLADYQTDRLLRQAVERNFEVIGEAVGRLKKFDPTMATRISQHAQIIGFRDLLIHGYDLIDHSQVWQVIVQDLPVLLTEVADLLRQDGSP